MDKLEDIVNLFVKWETKIFSRYSFINDMISENDKIDEEIARVEKEISKYKEQIDDEDKRKQTNLQRLKVMLLFI